MKQSDYDITTFGFEGSNKLWEHLLYIIDLNIKTESELAVDSDIKGEERIHACGRANALISLKRVLIDERKKGLDAMNINWKNSEEFSQED
jgi:hypothetical protein